MENNIISEENNTVLENTTVVETNMTSPIQDEETHNEETVGSPMLRPKNNKVRSEHVVPDKREMLMKDIAPLSVNEIYMFVSSVVDKMHKKDETIEKYLSCCRHLKEGCIFDENFFRGSGHPLIKHNLAMEISEKVKTDDSYLELLSNLLEHIKSTGKINALVERYSQSKPKLNKPRKNYSEVNTNGTNSPVVDDKLDGGSDWCESTPMNFGGDGNDQGEKKHYEKRHYGDIGNKRGGGRGRGGHHRGRGGYDRNRNGYNRENNNYNRENNNYDRENYDNGDEEITTGSSLDRGREKSVNEYNSGMMGNNNRKNQVDSGVLSKILQTM